MNIRTTPQSGLDQAHAAIEAFFAKRSEIASANPAFLEAFATILETFRKNRTLYLCGNGGSYADCLHITGELFKTFTRPRPLPLAHRNAFQKTPEGAKLVPELQAGFRTITLGQSGPVTSAIWNDAAEPNIHYAQELYVMGEPGDTLLVISTSGRSKNVLYAMTVAHALEIPVISLTGPDGNGVAERADVAIRVPGESTPAIQEAHLPCYHLLCQAIETAFFPAG